MGVCFKKNNFRAPLVAQSWVFIGRTGVEAETPILWPPALCQHFSLSHVWHFQRCKELTHLKRPWCWERLRAGGEGDERGWDGWMASPTWWTWVWVDSSSWWWTVRPGVLRFMGSKRIRHDWATELNWTEVDSNLFQAGSWSSITHAKLLSSLIFFSSSAPSILYSPSACSSAVQPLEHGITWSI